MSAVPGFDRRWVTSPEAGRLRRAGRLEFAVGAAVAVRPGRRVFWIEDFSGMAPADELPGGVVYVDTAPGLHTQAVLRPEHLPRMRRPR